MFCQDDNGRLQFTVEDVGGDFRREVQRRSVGSGRSQDYQKREEREEG
jgi:hypothetical protein